MMGIRSAVVFVLLASSCVVGCQRRPVIQGPTPPPMIAQEGQTLFYITRFTYVRPEADSNKPDPRSGDDRRAVAPPADQVNDDHPFYLDYYAAAENKKQARNEIIYDLIGFVDTAHNEYESALRFYKAFQESGFDIAEASLTLAAALAGGEQAKTVLSAITLFVQGTEAAIDEAFFRTEIVEALQLEARKNRAEVLEHIYKMMKKNLTDYPLDAGLRDVARLYYAGSLTRAIQTLSETTGEAARAAEEDAQKALTGEAVAEEEED